MNTYHYAYRRVENTGIICGAMTADTFEKVLYVLTEISTSTMEVIYIIKVS